MTGRKFIPRCLTSVFNAAEKPFLLFRRRQRHSALMRAVIYHDIPRIKTLVTEGADVRDNNNEALEEIVRRGNVEALHFLLQTEKVGIHDDYDLLLRLAIRHVQRDVVRYLIAEGANVHVLDDAPIIEVAGTRNHRLMELLLHCKADPNARNGLPLALAAKRGDAPMMEILLQAGADPKSGHHAALYAAVRAGQAHAVRLLHAAGADIYVRDHLFLSVAAAFGHTQVVELLLELGAKLEGEEDPALRLAKERGQKRTANTLLRKLAGR